jgi:nucleoside-diphosphate-sugar epimerase
MPKGWSRFCGPATLARRLPTRRTSCALPPRTPLAILSCRQRPRLPGQRQVGSAIFRPPAFTATIGIFRLAGIYGPGRGPFEKVRDGTARRIIKAGQVFGRIHVDDIAQVLEASIRHPNPGAAYNICDDNPCPPQDVIAHAARLLGLPEPPEVAFEDADLGPMARSFYSESKRTRNARIKDELGVRLLYPDYPQGLAALLRDEQP